MKKCNLYTSFFFLLFLISNLFSQQENKNIKAIKDETTLNWGYSYDSTLTYLEKLEQSPYVKIDSIGASVEGRAIWMVNVSEPIQHFETTYRVAIHARTHPNEVQSQWLTQRIIDILIGDSEIAKTLRNRVIFNIVPMYNPDGVELEFYRQNANGIDLERNWFVDDHEPEVFALKNKYYELMNSYTPIDIMLNMHGDGGANRAYFYYHHENGTSIKFTEDEKRFIGLIRKYFPDGIRDWDRSVTWEEGNPMLFPESWFWVNYEESVMAITFEEITIPNRFDSLYTKTASSILNGIADYLDIRNIVNVNDLSHNIFAYLSPNFPNPFNPSTVIKYSISNKSYVSLKVYDLLGREVAELVSTDQTTGSYSVEFNASQLASGVYFYKIMAGDFVDVKKMILLR